MSLTGRAPVIVVAIARMVLMAFVVGAILAPHPLHAATFQEIPPLPGTTAAQPFGVSADGSVVVGQSCGGACHAFRWTAATGTVDLGALPGDTTAFAFAVSADGSVIVGQSCNPAVSCRAFGWTEANGMTSLGTLPGDNTAEGIAVSADGSVVVGPSCSAAGCHAFRWTEGTGMVGRQRSTRTAPWWSA